MKTCIDCGKEIDERAKRCLSCAAVYRSKIGTQAGLRFGEGQKMGEGFKKGESRFPEYQFKKGEKSKNWNGWKKQITDEESRERGRIRNKDRLFFKRKISPEFLIGMNVHHDWSNGGICYIIPTEEHINFHKEMAKQR